MQNADSAHSPVLHGIKGLFVSDVVHKDEAHGSSIVGCGDCSVPLLACCVLWQHKHKWIHISMGYAGLISNVTNEPHNVCLVSVKKTKL